MRRDLDASHHSAIVSKRLRTAAGVVLLAWLGSLALPAAWLEGGREHGFAIMGYALLLVGPLGLADHQFGWFANPLLLLMLALVTRPQSSRRWRIGAGAALLLSGLSALTWRDWPDLDASGTDALAAWGPGFYLWLALVLGTAAATLYLTFHEREPA